MPRLPVAAVLLLAAVLPAARGDVVSTASYTCDPSTCLPPACMCAANHPPGGLTSAQMPQFILLSHDNALNANAFNLSQELYASIQQRNNCPVPLTWQVFGRLRTQIQHRFAMRYHSSCTSGKAAIARGDELAMQANRFYPTDPFTSTDPNPNYDSRDPVTRKPSVEIEITMSRQWWHDTCGIPLRNMVGYRSQGYYNNAPIRQTLMKHGYLYDSTLIERWYTWNPTSPSADAMLMPYTMDAGIPQECNFLGDTIGSCSSSEAYPGLWEVPLWQLQEAAADVLYGFSNYGDTKTPGVPAISDLYTLLKSQLDARLAGGRAPMQLSSFYEWLSVKPATPPADDPSCLKCYRAPSANALALVKFIKYAVQQPDVWFVTYSDLIRWMQSPVPKDQFADWWGAGCRVPGVKADLSAVNLSPAEKAEGAPVLAGSPSPSPSPSPTPSPSASPVASPVPSPSTAPSPSPSPASPVPATSPTGNMATGALSPSPAPAGTATITNSSRLARLPGALVAALLGLLGLLLAL